MVRPVRFPFEANGCAVMTLLKKKNCGSGLQMLTMAMLARLIHHATRLRRIHFEIGSKANLRKMLWKMLRNDAPTGSKAVLLNEVDFN